MDRVRRFTDPARRAPARAGFFGSFGSFGSAIAVLAVAAAAALSTVPACGQASETGGSKSPDTEGAPAEGAAAPQKGAASMAEGLRIAWLPAELTRYSSEIEAAARRHGVDPSLVAIIALVESGGNPAAVSGGGAVGLMQIMPKTAEKIAEERGIADYSPAKLREPGYNIDFAAYLLARHMRDLAGGAKASDEAVALTAAAYNAGAGRVRAYLEGAAPLNEETARYKEVVAGMWRERGASGSPTYENFRKENQQRK